MNKIILTAAILALTTPAWADDRDLTKIIPNPQLGVEWPTPTADDAIRLPAEGCKPQLEVAQLRSPLKGAALREFYKSDEGKCFSWYNRNMLQAKIVDEGAAKAASEAIARGETPKPQ